MGAVSCLSVKAGHALTSLCRLKPSTYRAHLGPQARKILVPALPAPKSGKKTSVKKSVLRREMLFDLADAQPSMVGSSLLSTAAPTRRFNQERHEHLLAFVRHLTYAYMVPAHFCYHFIGLKDRGKVPVLLKGHEDGNGRCTLESGGRKGTKYAMFVLDVLF
jgi:hypothetical protein